MLNARNFCVISDDKLNIYISIFLRFVVAISKRRNLQPINMHMPFSASITFVNNRRNGICLHVAKLRLY